MQRVVPATPVRVAMVIVASGAILTSCTAGSSGGESGAYSGESRSACGDDSSQLDISVNNISPVASRVGIERQTTPDAALRLALVQGQDPYFGGSDGSGLVGIGYPADGWERTSYSGTRATFRAPYASGAAKITLTRVDGRWLVSHAERGC